MPLPPLPCLTSFANCRNPGGREEIFSQVSPLGEFFLNRFIEYSAQFRCLSLSDLRWYHTCHERQRMKAIFF